MNLQEISAMCNLLLDVDRQIEQQETILSELKERSRSIREETIPMSMQELGLESVTMSTGEKVTISQEVYASIPAAQKEQAYAWLEEHGFGGLIKTLVATEFGKGELAKAQALFEQLSKQGVPAEMTRSVHAQTLKAFLKEQLAAGSDINLELFGARPTWTTKIKSPKG